MEYGAYIAFLNRIEKLKCNTRHSWTSDGRRESVAEHSWRLAVMAMLCADEYPELDMNKVIQMCLVHDWGEAITGDIPAFWKTQKDEAVENRAVAELLSDLPEPHRSALQALFAEMEAKQTPEAKLYKALDNLETLISHNEADLSTWLPREYTENLTYGQENCRWSAWTQGLKEAIKQDSLEKIAREKIREE